MSEQKRPRTEGGPVDRTIYTVAEYQPETFVPAVGGYIIPFEVPVSKVREQPRKKPRKKRRPPE